MGNVFHFYGACNRKYLHLKEINLADCVQIFMSLKTHLKYRNRRKSGSYFMMGVWNISLSIQIHLNTIYFNYLKTENIDGKAQADPRQIYHY